MMDTLHLDQLDELLLKQIVKKFTAREGAKFYRCCRETKDFVESIKPVWSLPGFKLSYHSYKSRNFYSKTLDISQTPRLPYNGKPEDFFGNIAIEYCRLETVFMLSCDSNFLREVIVSDLAAWGAVEKINFIFDNKLSDEDIRILLAAAKPAKVMFSGNNYDTDVFKGVKHLDIAVNDEKFYTFWGTNRIFELARHRKTITLSCNLSCNKHIFRICPVFLQNWLAGESTGSLEKLAVVHAVGREGEKYMERLKSAMQELLQNFVNMPKGYVVERGVDRLRVCTDFTSQRPEIVFHFS